MSLKFDDVTVNTVPVVSVTDNATRRDNFTEHLQNVKRNISFRDNCIPFVFSEMEFLPWNNPDSIVSTETENKMRMMKNTLLGLLFLIGGPANVINMAVFYKLGLKDRVNLCLFVLSFTDGMFLTMSIVHHGEQLFIQFTTKERFGPVSTFLTNLNLVVLTGPFTYVSQILSAIIATDRCLCVFNPLKVHSLLRTRTMMMIILLIYAVVFGLYFIVSFRYRIGCVYDPVWGVEIITSIEGEFYRSHKAFIDSLDNSVFGVGLPGAVVLTVGTTTVMTVVKLRQIVSWRSKTSSSISPREVALTKILLGTSVFFMVCTSPIALNHFIWIFFPEVSIGGRNQNFFLTGIWLGVSFSYVNATFNFIIYFIMGSQFRETFWAMLGRQSQVQRT